MTNEQRIIEAAKQHRAGVKAHKFNTAFGWKKAGFCPSAKAKFSARLCFKTGKGFIWKDEPIYRDDQVTAIAQAQASAPKAQAQEKPQVSAPVHFCKSVTIGNGESVIFYDEAVYGKFAKAQAKAWEYFHRLEKATEDRKREYFEREARWFSNRAREIATAYANA